MGTLTNSEDPDENNMPFHPGPKVIKKATKCIAKRESRPRLAWKGGNRVK